MPLVQGLTHGGEVKPLVMDDWSWHLVEIGHTHHMVHDGEAYQIWYWANDVADGSSIEILIRTGGDAVHMIYDAVAGGDATAHLIENPTVNAVGTALTEYNLNRTSTNTPSTVTYHTPTVAAGTELVAQLLPGGQGPKAGGGQVAADSEWVLKPNEDYVFRVTNISGNAQPLGLVVEWYEQASH
jgi:hypothetical protein